MTTDDPGAPSPAVGSPVPATMVPVPAAEAVLVQTQVEGLWATPPAPLPYQPDVLLRSFVLERPEGNLIVYNSPGLALAAASVRELGGADRLLINHAHEAMYGDPSIDVPAFVHQHDRAETALSMRVAGVFTERQMIAHDLEVVPTPGHTPGTTSYLWDSGSHRVLFTGDFVWIDNGDWKAVVLASSDRQQYLDSLRLVRDLTFDVLVPWGVTQGGSPVAVAQRTEVRKRIGEIITRVADGADR